MKRFEDMGKDELRKACKNAGIPYGKLNNDGMRAALAEKYSEQVPMGVVKPTTSNTVTPDVPVALKDLDPAKHPQVAENVKSWDKVTGKGLKIEKNREERNGVKRPSVGGHCRAVWDALDKIGAIATAKEVKALAEANGWNVNNASIEFYQWRKFNGITGRQKKAS